MAAYSWQAGARRRVRGDEVAAPDADLAHQRQVVDAFFAAARGGNFDRLVALLDPDVVLRIDGGRAQPAASVVLQGADAVAEQARRGVRAVLNRPVVRLHPTVVNGAAGIVVTLGGEPATVMGFAIANIKIVEIDAIADPERVRKIAPAVATDES